MKIIPLIGFFLLTILSYGQEADMADEMRGNGKIYVVVAVMLVILLGLLFYLISIDRKLNRIEKEHVKETES